MQGSTLTPNNFLLVALGYSVQVGNILKYWTDSGNLLKISQSN